MVALKGLQFVLRENYPIVQTCQVNNHSDIKENASHCQLRIFLNILACENVLQSRETMWTATPVTSVWVYPGDGGASRRSRLCAESCCGFGG